ncbi:MAG: TetR/AcrR family transcriptional regulator [Gammaproteobacteria bacterium]|nr:TetR/AcrR family transcriptional regulator [Gammaproteobacteria bacterium]
MECDAKKQIILQTATRHFANAGFDGARVDEIAAEAGVNKATLYYRIGNKEALYEAIFVEIISNVLKDIENNLISSDSPEQQLKSFASMFAKSLEDNPSMAPLILREIASGGTHMNDQAISKMHEIRSILSAILKRGEAENIFHPTNPFLIHILLIGTLNFYSASASIRSKLSQTATQEKNNEAESDQKKNKFIQPIEEVATEVVNLILNSIRIK